MLKILFLTYIIFISSLFALTPMEIAQKTKDASSAYQSSKSVMEMILIDQTKSKSKRLLYSISLEADKDSKTDGDKSLMEFKTPLDVKGTKFLSHEKITRDNDQWLYIPALKRVKRISSKNKSGSFMGSEFSYEDISSREISKYNYSKDAEKINLDTVKAYKYERYPKDEHSGYSKQVIWVDSDRFIVLKTQYYDKKGELLKTSIYSGYKKVKDTYRVSKIVMQNHQNKKSSSLEYLEDEIHLNLGEKDFSKRALR